MTLIRTDDTDKGEEITDKCGRSSWGGGDGGILSMTGPPRDGTDIDKRGAGISPPATGVHMMLAGVDMGLSYADFCLSFADEALRCAGFPVVVP